MTKEFTDLYFGKRIVITGCSGYIAGALISSLKHTNVEMIGVSRSEQLASENMSFLQGNLSEYGIWEKIIDHADIIFHLAGNTSVYTAANDPKQSFISSVLPVMNLVRAAKVKGKKVRVVYASTATLYGFPKKLPIDEHTYPEPVTIYDLHKLFAESELRLASSQGILESVSLRLANVYGPSPSLSSSYDRGIVNRLAKQALDGINIKVYGDGNYKRDYVYIDDVVTSFLLAGVTDNVNGKSFVIASGKSITVFEAFSMIADEAEKISGKKITVGKTEWPGDADPIEKRDFVANTDNLKVAFGWKPTVMFRDGLRKMLQTF